MNPQVKRLAIVISTHKRTFSVERLLESLKLQTLNRDNFSVFVAMNTKDIEMESALVKWKEEFDLSWGSTGEMGVNKARNYGIRHARADIILLFDDDMELIDRDLLQKHLSIHSDPSVDAVGGIWKLPIHSGLIALAYHVIGMSWLLRYRETNNRAPFLLGGHASYKKRIFEEGYFFDPGIVFGGSETEFNLRLYLGRKKMLLLDEISAIHHNEVGFKGFIRKSYLQGFHSEKRKKFLENPKPKMKSEKAVSVIIEREKIGKAKEIFIKCFIALYNYVSELGTKDFSDPNFKNSFFLISFKKIFGIKI